MVTWNDGKVTSYKIGSCLGHKVKVNDKIELISVTKNQSFLN
jgi:hypothetical protein